MAVKCLWFVGFVFEVALSSQLQKSKAEVQDGADVLFLVFFLVETLLFV